MSKNRHDFISQSDAPVVIFVFVTVLLRCGSLFLG